MIELVQLGSVRQVAGSTRPKGHPPLAQILTDGAACVSSPVFLILTSAGSRLHPNINRMSSNWWQVMYARLSHGVIVCADNPSVNNWRGRARFFCLSASLDHPLDGFPTPSWLFFPLQCLVPGLLDPTFTCPARKCSLQRSKCGCSNSNRFVVTARPN